MRDDMAAGPFRQGGDQGIIVLGQGKKVAVISIPDGIQKALAALVHSKLPAVLFHIVHGADHIIKQRPVYLGKDILLNAQQNADAARVPLLQAADLGAVIQNLLCGHAAGVLLKRRVPGETDLRAAEAEGFQDQLFRAVRAVAEDGMGVEVGKHQAIFSCFTLWSMTWREASSRRISSGRMPISTIRTIT